MRCFKGRSEKSTEKRVKEQEAYKSADQINTAAVERNADYQECGSQLFKFYMPGEDSVCEAIEDLCKQASQWIEWISLFEEGGHIKKERFLDSSLLSLDNAHTFSNITDTCNDGEISALFTLEELRSLWEICEPFSRSERSFDRLFIAVGIFYLFVRNAYAEEKRTESWLELVRNEWSTGSQQGMEDRGTGDDESLQRRKNADELMVRWQKRFYIPFSVAALLVKSCYWGLQSDHRIWQTTLALGFQKGLIRMKEEFPSQTDGPRFPCGFCTSIRGISHDTIGMSRDRASRIRCDDYCDVLRWTTTDGKPCLCVAVADGVGSKNFSDKGSEAAVKAFFALAREMTDRGTVSSYKNGTTIGGTLYEKWDVTLREMGHSDCAFEIDEYATTLIAVLIWGEYVYCFHIGDGNCIAYKDGFRFDVYDSIGSDDPGRTHSVVDLKDHPEWLGYQCFPKKAVDHVLLSSDGFPYHRENECNVRAVLNMKKAEAVNQLNRSAFAWARLYGFGHNDDVTIAWLDMGHESSEKEG